MDPGTHTGAIALISGDARRVLMVSAFTVGPKGCRVRTSSVGDSPRPMRDEETWSTLHGVGMVWRVEIRRRDDPLDGLVVEGLFPNRKDPGSTLTLAEGCGKLHGPIEGIADCERRIPANVWRPEQIGSPPRAKPTAAHWEAWSLQRARTAWREFDLLTEGWTKAEQGSASEALWMARAGWCRRVRGGKG